MEQEIPTENLLYEDEDLKIVLPLDPISRGHVLLIPKEKFNGIDDLPGPLLDKLLSLVQAVVRMQKKVFGAKGYSLMQNGGAFSESDRFQLHLFPRRNKEEFAWTYSEEVDAAAKEFQKVRELLSKDFKALLP